MAGILDILKGSLSAQNLKDAFSPAGFNLMGSAAAQGLSAPADPVPDQPPIEPDWDHKKENINRVPLIHAYRPAPQMKDGLESLPTKFDPDAMRTRLAALRDAATSGANIPKEMLDPAYLTALALKEGRSDFGGSDTEMMIPEREVIRQKYYKNLPPVNKKSLALVQSLIDSGHSPMAAAFAGLVSEKNRVAQQKRVPFLRAWNGLGTSQDGQSGEQYAHAVENKYLSVATHPKNSSLYHFIKGSLAPAEPGELPSNYRAGGRVRII
jgi:hypothetical protein